MIWSATQTLLEACGSLDAEAQAVSERSFQVVAFAGSGPQPGDRRAGSFAEVKSCLVNRQLRER